MAIEVGDTIRYKHGQEYVVQYLGKTHGIAAKVTGEEMSFHADSLTHSNEWILIKAMPKVATSWFLIIGGTGQLEGAGEDAAQAWFYLEREPAYYSGVIRVNPDRTWDYVNEDDAVILP